MNWKRAREARRRLAAGFLLGLALAPAAGRAEPLLPLEIRQGERLLVIAPHPDDESLCCGGLIQSVLARGGSVRVVTLTAGDGFVEGVRRETGHPMPRPSDYEEYGELRIGELRNALRILGGGAVTLDELGFPDGALLPLLYAHWDRTDPEPSPTTRATAPPYREVRDPSVRYDGSDVLRELSGVVRTAQPTLVALPDPEDAHPDHSATGSFGLQALAEVARERTASGAGDTIPRVLAYLVHWPEWPSDPGDLGAAESRLDFPPDLETRGYPHVELSLTPAQLERKRAALGEHATQQRAMGSFLTLLARRNEIFSLLGSEDVRNARRPARRTAAAGGAAPAGARVPAEGR